MRLLLDTCAFLWLAGQPAKLSAPVVVAINLKSEIQTAKNAKYAKGKGGVNRKCRSPVG